MSIPKGMTKISALKRSASILPTIDRSKLRIAMVGFFDLLGFSDRVQEAETEDDFAVIATAVSSIQRHFEFRSKDESIRQVHGISDKNVLAFSDCIVTSVSFETRMVKTEGPFDVLGSEIFVIAYTLSTGPEL
jgi:hypothetical protein